MNLSSIHFPSLSTFLFLVSFNGRASFQQRGARCPGDPRDQPLGPRGAPNTGDCGAAAAQLAASADHSIGRSPGRAQHLGTREDQRGSERISKFLVMWESPGKATRKRPFGIIWEWVLYVRTTDVWLHHIEVNSRQVSRLLLQKQR